MKTPIEVLRETVRPSVTHEQRLRWDDACADWAVCNELLGSSKAPFLYHHTRKATGKLVVVERTITERIVGEYTINKDGSLTKDEI